MSTGVLSQRTRIEDVYCEKSTRQKPPHHLTETQIFRQLQKNDIFQVEPEQLSFICGQSKKEKIIKIINTSGLRQNFHVIEPIDQSKWQISYLKPDGGLVPGGHVNIHVKFNPPSKTNSFATGDNNNTNDQNPSTYQDAIRIHCSSENLLIPLYAYYTIDSRQFPRKINFGSVPLGQETQRTITLNVPENESFEFNCQIIPPLKPFEVTPCYGTLRGKCQISLTYRPTEFVTSATTLQIIFATFDRKVLKCELNGNCLPGLLTLKKKREFEIKKREDDGKNRRVNNISDKQVRNLSCVGNIRSLVNMNSTTPTGEPTKDSKTENSSKQNKMRKSEATIGESGKIKIELGAQHHINKILNSKEIKIKKEIEDDEYISLANTFRHQLRGALEAEKTNKLRWQVRCGDSCPSIDIIEDIMTTRGNQRSCVSCRTERCARAPDKRVIYKTKTVKSPSRMVMNNNVKNNIKRVDGKAPGSPGPVGKTGPSSAKSSRSPSSAEAHHYHGEPIFDLYRNSPWRGRHFALGRFQQAARTVLIRIRAEGRLQNLRRLISLVNQGMTVDAAEAALTGSLDQSKIFQLITTRCGLPYIEDRSATSTIFEPYRIIESYDPVNEEQLPIESDFEKAKSIFHRLEVPEYNIIQGYEGRNPYSWDERLNTGTIKENSEHLREEPIVDSMPGLTVDDMENLLNDFETLSSKANPRTILSGNKRFSRWSSLTQGLAPPSLE